MQASNDSQIRYAGPLMGNERVMTSTHCVKFREGRRRMSLKEAIMLQLALTSKVLPVSHSHTQLQGGLPAFGPSSQLKSYQTKPLARRQSKTRAQWLENSAEVDVAAPLDHCWRLWEDQELIPNWMPWIDSVKVYSPDKKESKWTLRTNQFGRDWELSWAARLLTPVKRQKIHWRSIPGSMDGIEVANRGQIRFYPRGEDRCSVKLTISYELPDIMAPFGGAVTPVVENILNRDMKRFAEYAVSH